MAALEFAIEQVRLAQSGADGPRLQDMLVEVEDALSDQVSALRGAVADDEADAEASGERARERLAAHPRYAAA